MYSEPTPFKDNTSFWAVDRTQIRFIKADMYAIENVVRIKFLNT